MGERNLVEPEGVNAGSSEAMREAGGSVDPVPGGEADRADGQLRPEPAERLVGPPDESDEQAYGSESYGSNPAGPS